MEKAAGGYWARLTFNDGRKRVLIPARTKADATKAAKAIKSAIKDGATFDQVQRAAAALAVSQNAFNEALRQSKAVAVARPAKLPKKLAGPTWLEVAELWTSGELAKRFPDSVKPNKRSVEDDKQRVRHLSQTIGNVPMTAFTRDHAKAAMAALPATCRTAASRRHYAQVINRVVNLAVEPLGLISLSPLPPGWMPKIGKVKQGKAFLYPSEDAKLLSCTAVPLHRRILYMLCSREGFRKSEAQGLTWNDLDLTLGVVKLDVNKTDMPRAWALDAGCVEAFAPVASAERSPSARACDPALRWAQASQYLRTDMKRAGLTRPELYGGENRIAMRLHDLRGTFTTLALATGKTEGWVQSRTGHQSSEMIARYRQLARTAEEVGLGWFEPAYTLIPELAALESVQKSVQTEKVSRRRSA